MPRMIGLTSFELPQGAHGIVRDDFYMSVLTYQGLKQF